MKNINILGLSLLGFAFLSGCTKPSDLKGFLGMEKGPQLFSNRPQNVSHLAVIIELKGAPGVSSVQDGSVSEMAMSAIDKEQDAFIQKLKVIAPDSQVLFRYKILINAVAVVVPVSAVDQINAMARQQGLKVQKASYFKRPEPVAATLNDVNSSARSFSFERNSVKFIGADKVHEMTTAGAGGSLVSINGTGMSVGVIDTGIDFTHSMFAGPGTEEAFKAVDPSAPTSLFPNSKVVGGIDLVGTKYNSASRLSAHWIPIPDENPIDEGGHGTHVAGSVAGIGDGVNTYSGVAPGADLYAIKVFGAEGSTADFVVIAALEYSVDPNKDGNLEDKLDVVNLSLGGGYGIPKIMYEKAIANLAQAGTIAVIAAGNSGNEPYIVGAPSTSEAALSVAASVDDSDHNWNFGAVKFSALDEESILAESVEASITKPIAEAGDVAGPLVFIGLAAEELSPEMKEAVKGKVALIDRGQVTFAEKIKRAFEAGAIGVVVANNQSGAPLNMGGGTETFAIPGIMITQDLGKQIKKIMETKEVRISFQTPEKFEKPELIDTLTGFSSTGPRSIDGLFKPEISAPGSQIISADMGKGKGAVKLSGTSMAAPHMAGVMALVKQAHPDLTVKELKSLVMSTSKTTVDENKKTYMMSKQGVGRVQALKAVKSQIVASEASVSLGILGLQGATSLNRSVTLKNIGSQELSLNVSTQSTVGLQIKSATSLTLKPGESKSVELKMVVAAPKENRVAEYNGLWMLNNSDGEEVFRLPVLAIARQMSQVKAPELKVLASSDADSSGATSELSLENKSPHSARVFPMNLLGLDDRKAASGTNSYLSRDCDLQAVGYRVINKVVEGSLKQVLQVGAKLYNPLTTWNVCQLIVLIDTNKDQVPEQELAILPLGDIEGLSNASNSNKFYSVLLDAQKMRDLRGQFETSQEEDPKENYSSAALDAVPAMSDFSNSTVTIVEADVSLLSVRPTGELGIKVISQLASYDAIENDDYLQSSNEWEKISVNPESHSFLDLPELIAMKGGESLSLNITRGEGRGNLMLLTPDNRSTKSELITDDQMILISPTFGLN